MPSTERPVTRLYARVAGVYDAWTYFTESRSLDVALEEARIGDTACVLEVAVGTGVAFREVLRRNPSGRNVGIDITEPMLRRAREKAERAGVPFELLLGDAGSLPFADATFDVVMNNNMLGVVPESLVAPIVSEIFRVLRPGGRLVIVTMQRPRNRFSEIVYQVGAVWLGGWRDIDVAPAVRSIGFVDVRSRTVTQLGIPSEVLSARKPALVEGGM